MPITTPVVTARLGKLFADAATPGTPAYRKLMGNIAGELRKEARMMYRFGLDPFGSPWPLTKDGRQPYRSKKMGNALRVEIDRGDPGCVQVFYLVDWIEAADQGHTWPARAIAENRQYLTFRNGRLIREGAAFYRKGKKAGQVKRGVTQIFARAHTIGPRTLPPRQQSPRGVMPPDWGAAINRGAAEGMHAIAAAAVARTGSL